MGPGMANTEDGVSSWDTVLRFLKTPSPADYSFDFDASLRLEECEGPPFEENLVVDEYLFKQPHCISRELIYSKNQKLEWKHTGEPKADGKLRIDPAKFLKLTEFEMVQSLRRWKQLTHESIVHPVTIIEADVYALHPADLISGASTHYFYSATKYSLLKRPTRLRITENGCRWKQQGRIFPIRENGQTVAYKTYLSYVALKNGGNLLKKSSAPVNIDCAQPSTSKDVVCKRRDRKWSLWTMEEIGLAEDIQSERVVLRRGGRPRPFPVICRIVCKRDGTALAPLQTRLRCKKPTVRRETQIAEANPSDDDMSPVVSTRHVKCTDVSSLAEDHVQGTDVRSLTGSIKSTEGRLSSLARHIKSGVSSLPGHIKSEVSSLAGHIKNEGNSRAGHIKSEVNSLAIDANKDPQNILEDEIIRSLIYDLPYGKVSLRSYHPSP